MHQYTLCSDLSEMLVTTVALPRAPPWCVLGIKSRGRRMKCHGSHPQSWEPLGAVQDVTGNTGGHLVCRLD